MSNGGTHVYSTDQIARAGININARLGGLRPAIRLKLILITVHCYLLLDDCLDFILRPYR